MRKVSILYPNEKGKKFDMHYYCDKHIQMVKETTGDACKSIAVEQGVAGGTPGSEATYIAMAIYTSIQ